ncbi:MAG: hypothetical protein ACR2RF_14310 [Geminicoccaceae bacterium]
MADHGHEASAHISDVLGRSLGFQELFFVETLLRDIGDRADDPKSLAILSGFSHAATFDMALLAAIPFDCLIDLETLVLAVRASHQ